MTDLATIDLALWSAARASSGNTRRALDRLRGTYLAGIRRDAYLATKAVA